MTTRPHPSSPAIKFHRPSPSIQSSLLMPSMPTTRQQHRVSCSPSYPLAPTPACFWATRASSHSCTFPQSISWNQRLHGLKEMDGPSCRRKSVGWAGPARLCLLPLLGKTFPYRWTTRIGSRPCVGYLLDSQCHLQRRHPDSLHGLS
ncbi:hypothetical protein BCR44DRAFT_1062211 [Catenaria anguillulae PL171]|uniref:Uncharacterized protein n=1 Tax=Catenaria anguillulae PL171 TaxID=765915 RepID=A0A1Y2HQP5_9FUNG|nr:hypothetical protein BCR44DRAFT_1062211 [Catenaria anguillulae PL171]